MRTSIFLVALLLSSCSGKQVGHIFFEGITNSDLGYNAASCNQIKSSCDVANSNNPESYRNYTQWKNDNNDISCSCSNK
ncbi:MULTISPECIES: hypothetical protein [unclassified Colwellia]|jgi:hypothetical protein|nr:MULTISPECIES: hypothetical protein [unclassified Colwellia]MBA6381391.1 hypothetical protein [Colwellia sp. BRX10-7]MBA6389142.1 hypothetical protein [Colwellia sp. BRX10-2]MBA6403861.1 hypothetical protein [Colwellia sp. BRX10-5]MBA6407732.1 hypothetical protein [Colwellia sp. BRX10-1]